GRSLAGACISSCRWLRGRGVASVMVSRMSRFIQGAGTSPLLATGSDRGWTDGGFGLCCVRRAVLGALQSEVLREGLLAGRDQRSPLRRQQGARREPCIGARRMSRVRRRFCTGGRALLRRVSTPQILLRQV